MYKNVRNVGETKEASRGKTHIYFQRMHVSILLGTVVAFFHFLR